LVSKQIAAILTILGGVFYLFGSFAGVLLFGSLLGFESGLSRVTSPGRGLSLANASATALGIFVFGILAAILIIAGGAYLNSDNRSYRRSGGILAIIMMILGAVPDVGGFFIGFVFVLIGSVLGLTYKETSPDVVIGFASAPNPASAYTLQSQQTSAGSPSSGQFCIKCGKQLYEGAQFCKFCGSPVPH
jgi:hypothetical protein